MSAEVFSFPTKEAVEENRYGPPSGSVAWRCGPCLEDPDVPEAGEFCFYVTAAGIHCWTCRNIQDFPCE